MRAGLQTDRMQYPLVCAFAAQTCVSGGSRPKSPGMCAGCRFYDDIVYDPKLALRIESSEEGDRLAGTASFPVPACSSFQV